jgi:retron-type reverse transcriptase
MPQDAPPNGSARDEVPQGPWSKVAGMQAKLHRWAAADPGRRFDDLFNLVHDPATLKLAFFRVATNQGANTPGVDGVTAAWVEEQVGVPGFLDDLRAAVKDGSFRPLPVRERLIPKPGGSGKLRKLGIPCIADRVVQAALKLVLEPIFEADFEPCSYGFRPKRRAQDAIAEIHHFGTRGYRWVLDADIEAAFDNCSHSAVMKRVRARVKDKRVLALVKAFLKAGVLTELGEHRDTLTGTPQGGGATRGRTCMSGLRQWRFAWRRRDLRPVPDGLSSPLTCVAGNGGVRSSGGSRRLLVHPGEYGREEDRTGESREPSLMPRDCGPLPDGCWWQGFRAGRWEAAGAARDIPFRAGGHHRPGVKKAPSPIGSHACGTWKPRCGPAGGW